MRPSRNHKNTGRSRLKQQSCPQYLRSTWASIHSDNKGLPRNDMATFLAAMERNRIAPWAYSQRIRSTKSTVKDSQKTGRKLYKASSTPVLRSLGDTDDTEDEGFSHRCSVASSSHGSCECLHRQATSMGSLTSSYSSLGERSGSTLSPLDDLKPTSLKAILDPDFCREFDYDHDPLMRETIEDIVSPKPTKISRSVSLEMVSASGLAAMDPSILVALPGGTIKTEEASPAKKYAPTNLCDMSHFLASSMVSVADVANPRLDLALLRVGSLPVDPDKSLDPVTRKGWDIPESPESPEPEKDQHLVPQTRIAYRKLSETSDSEDYDCYAFPKHMLSPICNLSSSLSSTSRSRSSSLSSTRDSSDYLADISGEEMPTRRITVWPPSTKLKLDFEKDGDPFVLSPRIPGVAYYGVPTKNNVLESPGHISRGLEAFFNSRSIVHRLGPHGLEQVYDMEYCTEKCGFAYPVPSSRQEAVTPKNPIGYER